MATKKGDNVTGWKLDVKKRFSEEQIIGFLHEADAGLAIKELCRKHGFSEASYYLWRSKFGAMSLACPPQDALWLVFRLRAQ